VYFRYKDDQLIRVSDRDDMGVFPDGRCVLKIEPTNNDDTGSYVCEVSTESGSNRSQATVTVTG